MKLKCKVKTKNGKSRRTWNDAIKNEAEKKRIPCGGIKDMTMDEDKKGKQNNFNSKRLVTHGKKNTIYSGNLLFRRFEDICYISVQEAHEHFLCCFYA